MKEKDKRVITCHNSDLYDMYRYLSYKCIVYSTLVWATTKSPIYESSHKIINAYIYV